MLINILTWKLIDEVPGDENDIVHENFNNNIYINGNRCVTSLPFKSNVHFVPDDICHQRLFWLINKLNKNPILKKEYQNIIESYEKDKIFEKVSDVGVPGKVH